MKFNESGMDMFNYTFYLKKRKKKKFRENLNGCWIDWKIIMPEEEFRYIFTKNLFFLIPRKYYRVGLYIFKEGGKNSEKMDA